MTLKDRFFKATEIMTRPPTSKLEVVWLLAVLFTYTALVYLSVLGVVCIASHVFGFRL